MLILIKRISCTNMAFVVRLWQLILGSIKHIRKTLKLSVENRETMCDYMYIKQIRKTLKLSVQNTETMCDYMYIKQIRKTLKLSVQNTETIL